MDYDTEIQSLAGEVMALQALLSGLFMALKSSGNLHLVDQAFSYAETVVEAVSINLGTPDNATHLRKAVEVVESLRGAVLN